MKKTLIKIINLSALLVFAVLSVFTCFSETAEYEYTMTSDPAASLLKMDGINSSIEVIGNDTNVIKIRVEGIEYLPEIPEGMRSLLSSGVDNTGLGLELKMSDSDKGLIELKQVHRNNIGNKITIEVPKALSIDIKTHMHQGFQASNISGDVSAGSLNGSIILNSVTGPLALNTVNGKIEVDVISLNQDRPSSITTVNGKIDLILPVTEKATFDLSTIHGDIYTNLDLAEKGDHENMDHISGNIHTTLNGGGVSVTMSTVNGEICLRKAE